MLITRTPNSTGVERNCGSLSTAGIRLGEPKPRGGSDPPPIPARTELGWLGLLGASWLLPFSAHPCCGLSHIRSRPGPCSGPPQVQLKPIPHAAARGFCETQIAPLSRENTPTAFHESWDKQRSPLHGLQCALQVGSPPPGSSWLTPWPAWTAQFNSPPVEGAVMQTLGSYLPAYVLLIVQIPAQATLSRGSFPAKSPPVSFLSSLYLFLIL